MSKPTEEIFLKDVASHQMTIVLDHGVYRHLRFKQPDSNNMYFDIVTYPHFLVYSGDMGSYVFSRVNDMFCFFRAEAEGSLKINLGYWSEKLEATDRADGHKEYSAEKFRAFISDKLQEFKEYLERDADDDSAPLKFASLKAAIDSEVLTHAADGEYAVYEAMRDFEHDDRDWFCDFSESDFREYTFRFVWCCYALVWAIRQYDEVKAKAKADA